MKATITTIVVLLTTSLSYGDVIQKSGSYIAGYDVATQTKITKSIDLNVNTTTKAVDLSIDGIGILKGIVEGSNVTAYIPNPTKFFYLKLEMKPELQDGAVLISKEGASTRTCSEGSTALLTFYRGDGTNDKKCVKF